MNSASTRLKAQARFRARIRQLLALGLLLAWDGLTPVNAVLINGVELWATSSDETLLPSTNITLTTSGTDLVVNIATLPDAEGTVEINFWALLDGQSVRLIPQFVQTETLAPLKVAAHSLGGNIYVAVEWEGEGVLQESTNPADPASWQDVPDATPPNYYPDYTDPGAPIRFYRLRK